MKLNFAIISIGEIEAEAFPSSFNFGLLRKFTCNRETEFCGRIKDWGINTEIKVMTTLAYSRELNDNNNKSVQI